MNSRRRTQRSLTRCGMKTIAASLMVVCPTMVVGDTLIADLDADYTEVAVGQTTASGGPVNAAGNGTWDYFGANAASSGTFSSASLTLLPVVAGNVRYSIGNQNINDATVYGTDIALPADRLYIHPNTNASTTARWTAGGGEVGFVNISGVVQRGNQDNTPTQNGSTFAIFKSDAAQTLGSFVNIYQQNVPFENSTTQPFTEYDFNVNTNIAAGEKLFLAVFSDGNTSADGLQVAAQVTGRSDTIGINFDSDRSDNAASMVASDVAGVVARGNWNNAFNAVSDNSPLSVTNLTDNWGDDSGARVDWTSGGGSWVVGSQDPTLSGDHKMMTDHLDARSPDDASITVSNLPAWMTANGYDVYVYTDAETANGLVTSGYTIDDGVNPTQTFWLTDTATFSGTFVQATGTTKATATTGANYILFENLTSDSFTLLADSDLFRAEVSGIQIVANAPEPATIALVVLACIGFMVLRRFPGRRA